jgi:hypothetical protein
MSFLVANLSIPASDEEKVKDAFQNALQWEYSKYTNPIYSLFFSQPKTAVIYAQKEFVDELILRDSNNPFQLGGPMSATFASGPTFPSACIEIECQQADHIVNILSALRDALPVGFGSFVKGSVATLRFPNATDAFESQRALSSLGIPGVTARVLSVGEHVSLRCGWQGSSSLAATVKRLKSTGQNLTSLVQSCVR